MDWTSLILPIYTVEIAAILVASVYSWLMNSRVEEGWSRLSPGGLLWVVLFITSLWLPFLIPQFLVDPPSLNDGAAWYLITAAILAFWLRSLWALVRFGRQRVSWKGSVIRFNDHGAMTDIDSKTSEAVRFGRFDVSLLFSSGVKLAIDRGSVGLVPLLGNLYANRPIFVWPRTL